MDKQKKCEVQEQQEAPKKLGGLAFFIFALVVVAFLLLDRLLLTPFLEWIKMLLNW